MKRIIRLLTRSREKNPVRDGSEKQVLVRATKETPNQPKDIDPPCKTLKMGLPGFPPEYWDE